MDANEVCDPLCERSRTISNASQYSHQNSKHNFPLMTSDSGLYSCSSNISDCSLQFESDTDSSLQSSGGFKDERLQLALQDVRKLRSELERLKKSEQWYKQELKQQKSTRLDNLERIYTQERKFMTENQRLQKECVRLYEKCSELEKELEKQNKVFIDNRNKELNHEESLQESLLEFEKEQHLALIEDQQQLVSLLRKQKCSLLQDLKNLTAEKDEKVNELQRLVADLEFENKLITKKCTQYAKERINLQNTLRQTENNISIVQEEKLDLQKSIVDLKDQLEMQLQLLEIKENEMDKMQQHYTEKIRNEQDLDQVHDLSIKYQEEINVKTLEIINLKERRQEMEDEFEDMKSLQQQNELLQKQIDQLNCALAEYRFEIKELKTLDLQKTKQMEDLYTTIDHLAKDKEIAYKTTVEQQTELLVLKRALKSTQQQYEQVQDIYKNTQFQLELLEVENGKAKFKQDSDRKEMEHLRNKLKKYLEETTELSNKIQILERELKRVGKENSQLKEDTGEMLQVIDNLKKNVEEKEKYQIVMQEIEQRKDQDLNNTNLLVVDTTHRERFVQQNLRRISDDEDFLALQYECQKLQKRLDSLKEDETYFGNGQNEIIIEHKESEECLEIYNVLEDFTRLMHSSVEDETDTDIVKLSFQGSQLHKNVQKLNETLEEKQHLLRSVHLNEASNDGIEKLVNENETLKKKLNAIKTEALILQMQKEFKEVSFNYTQHMEENLKDHGNTVETIETNLLENGSKLYKIERKLEKKEEINPNLAELQIENPEICQAHKNKTELKSKLEQETGELKDLKQSLDDLKLQKTPTINQDTQFTLPENFEISELKKHVLELQQEQRQLLQQEALKKEKRLQFLQEMMDLQSNKIQNLQQHQKDWEDILIALNDAHGMEEQSRKEIELKRMELEELNQVFAEQNEEFRKLEESTALLEIKRQNEKKTLKLTFQQEINVMKQHLEEYQTEIEQQKLVNQKLEKQNYRYQHDINVDFAFEVAGYKREISELKSKLTTMIEEKEDLLVHVKELKNETKDIKENKREAILMPCFSLSKVMDTSVQSSVENLEILNENVCEDHLRILTKVLEAEYQRKMLRYDEHIQSLLSDLKSLKKSLKCNEEKTAALSEIQIKTQEELKDLQSTKRSLQEMCLKYEQSQNTIKELKDTLALERKRFQLADSVNSSHNSTVYEVSNLIDDYKKLIQQSAIVTKRPSTSDILSLIQRSNECVPNLHKLETNVEGLRSDLHSFLVSYSHKIPSNSLIATASLSVPPSLMDELRSASEGF